MLLLETEIYGLTGERLFWVKSLKDSTIISCVLSVNKIALKGFDYSVEKEKRMKGAEAQIIPWGVRNTCVCIVIVLLLTMLFLAVHSLAVMKFLSCFVLHCQ